MNTAFDELRVENDGLICPEVGRWSEDKYRLVALYAQLFSTGMKDKWDERVYIDLYAGAGYSRIQGTPTVLKGSPVLALTVKHPFDKYILCEANPELMDALRERTKRISPDANIDYVIGDCNSEIDRICGSIPKHSPGRTVLSLCFVDPFDFGIKFETLRKLSDFFVDFLVLLAIGMDANRNYEHYVDGESTKIDEALGNTDWRERWKQLGARRKDFRQYLATEFAKSMESLRYLPQHLHHMKQVRSNEKNLPLYYLVLFSRSETAYKFWKEVLKYSTEQQDLFPE